VTMSIEAIFFTIKSLLLEWSGQLIFLGLTLLDRDRRIAGALSARR
jgi:hypothetical protein